MKKTLCLSLFVVAVFFIIFSARPGVASTEAQNLQAACAADAEYFCPGMKPGDGQLMNCLMQKLCPDMAPGDGQLMNCLVQNESQLSPACAQQVQAIDNVRNQCAPDVSKLCPGINQRVKILECLKEHQVELTTECYNSLQGLEQPGP